MTPEERRLAVLCRIIRFALRAVTRIEIRGADRIGDHPPAVFAANHRSLADLWVGLSIFASIDVFPGILFSQRMLPGPLSRIAQALGVILVRDGGATAAGIDALRAGRSLMVMPEGGLHWDSEDPRQLGPIRPGIARMARAADVPIIPVAVDGTEVIWPHGRWPRPRIGRRQHIVVTFGEPNLVLAESTDQEAADAVMAVVAGNLTP